MNLTETKYSKFDLVKEMLETPDILLNFNFESVNKIADKIRKKKKLFITGEGSSRTFPSKNFIAKAKQLGSNYQIYTEGSRQLAEYKLNDYVVIGASNSGKTKEIVELFNKLKDNPGLFLVALTANPNTPLEQLSKMAHVLNCGKENAIAASKSTMEQALFFQALLAALEKESSIKSNLQSAAKAIKDTLTAVIPAAIVQKLAKAKMIFFAGRNNGVAEELTLKVNEITHKNSAYFEGTIVIHGPQEALGPGDAIVLIEPFKDEIAKFKQVLADVVGINVIAISKDETVFPTIKVPAVVHYDEFIQFAAGWNLLVETGISLGINIDKTERAKKVAQ